MKHFRQALRPGSARTTGLVLAGITLLVFAVIVIVFALRGGRSSQNPRSSAEVLNPDPDLLPTGAGNSSRFGGGQGFYIQVVDENDPSRVRAEISAARSQPVEGQTFLIALEKPVIWAFLKGGRIVYARGDTGTAYVPDQVKGMPSRPRDGMLQGNVIVKIFDGSKSRARPDPDHAETLAELHTNELKYDSELGQTDAPGPFKFTSPKADYDGSGLTVLFNDVQQRLEQLRVAKTDRVEYRPWVQTSLPQPKPAAPPLKTAAAAPANPSPAPTTSTLPPIAAKPPVTTLYKLLCQQDVVVENGTRRITSDRLDGWARLIDNDLRPGAIRSSNAATSTTQSPTTPTTAPARTAPAPAASTPPPAAVAPATDPDTFFGSGDSHEPVILHWAGPLDIRPIAADPVELASNDVFLRFTGQSDTATQFVDSHDSTKAIGRALEYAATQRTVVLSASDPLAAHLSRAESGEADVQRIEMNLITGVAHIPGAGRMTDRGHNPAPIPDPNTAPQSPTDRTLTWTDSANFRFELDPKKEVSRRLAEVQAQGHVRMSDGAGSLSGSTMIAKFIPVDENTSRINRLSVVGNAHGEDGRSGTLDSDTLDVDFVPMPGRPGQSDPSTVTAQGEVRGTRTGSTLDAQWLRATLARTDTDSSGEPSLGVTNIDARDIVFVDDKGIRAVAPHLAADPIAQIVHLTGDAMTVRVEKDHSAIEGRDMTFMEVERRLNVEGAGRLTHTAAATETDGASDVIATWERQMSFDDIMGTAACSGDATAIMTKSALTGPLAQRDTMHADHVDLWLTPAQPGTKEPGDESPAPERRLLRAELSGSLAARPDGKRATLETRRYAPGDEVVLERVMYLEGARINADDARATLDVPTPGKLFILDRSPNAQPQKPADMMDLGAGRGTSLFTWSGSMNMQRTTGKLTMTENVHLTHQRGQDAEKSELECATLTALVREVTPEAALGDQPAAKDQSFSGELISADADGSTWMRYNGRELTADSAHYDAQNRVLHAKAKGANMVRMLDPRTGSPVTAKEITWDLVHDRIDIRRPGPVTIPR